MTTQSLKSLIEMRALLPKDGNAFSFRDVEEWGKFVLHFSQWIATDAHTLLDRYERMEAALKWIGVEREIAKEALK